MKDTCRCLEVDNFGLFTSSTNQAGYGEGIRKKRASYRVGVGNIAAPNSVRLRRQG